MAVPTKFRKELKGGAIVTRGLDHCLFVFDKSQWKDIASKIVDLPFAKANNRSFQRLMLAGAMEVSIDSQGRVLIPDYLRKYAGLKKHAVVAGLYDRLEIWDEIAWNENREKTEAASDEIAEQLGELGI